MDSSYLDRLGSRSVRRDGLDAGPALEEVQLPVVHACDDLALAARAAARGKPLGRGHVLHPEPTEAERL